MGYPNRSSEICLITVISCLRMGVKPWQIHRRTKDHIGAGLLRCIAGKHCRDGPLDVHKTSPLRNSRLATVSDCLRLEGKYKEACCPEIWRWSRGSSKGWPALTSEIWRDADNKAASEVVQVSGQDATRLPPPRRFSGQVQPGWWPPVDPELVGGSTCSIWPQVANYSVPWSHLDKLFCIHLLIFWFLTTTKKKESFSATYSKLLSRFPYSHSPRVSWLITHIKKKSHN